MHLETAMQEAAKVVNSTLTTILPLINGPTSRVIEAMHYAVMAGGKRVRPFLVIQSAQMFNVSKHSALRVAAATELVHTYSLIHDDLPAMDNDDLRRNRPTTHIKFDEATAILAGDALLTLAFETLGKADTYSDSTVRADLIVELARAAGIKGMVGGQIIDLRSEKHELNMAEITRLQCMKTGALMCFSCEAGAILGKAAPQARHALKAYSHDLGLAFQIIDDILDVNGDETAMGKRTNKDINAGKATFVSLLGLDRAYEQAFFLADQAIQHLDMFNEKAHLLRELAQFVVKRKY